MLKVANVLDTWLSSLTRVTVSDYWAAFQRGIIQIHIRCMAVLPFYPYFADSLPCVIE